MTNSNEIINGILVETFFYQKRKFADIYKYGDLYCVVKNGVVVDSNFSLEEAKNSVKEQIKEEEEI